ncbi:MAG: acyl carrier protein [Solirubrobacteraceae bacterium]
MRDRVRAIMADVFDVDPSELPDPVTSADLEQWDSLAHLSLMLELETEFGIEIASDAMGELLSLEAIVSYLQAAPA